MKFHLEFILGLLLSFFSTGALAVGNCANDPQTKYEAKFNEVTTRCLSNHLQKVIDNDAEFMKSVEACRTFTGDHHNSPCNALHCGRVEMAPIACSELRAQENDQEYYCGGQPVHSIPHRDEQK